MLRFCYQLRILPGWENCTQEVAPQSLYASQHCFPFTQRKSWTLVMTDPPYSQEVFQVLCKILGHTECQHTLEEVQFPNTQVISLEWQRSEVLHVPCWYPTDEGNKGQVICCWTLGGPKVLLRLGAKHNRTLLRSSEYQVMQVCSHGKARSNVCDLEQCFAWSGNHTMDRMRSASEGMRDEHF